MNWEEAKQRLESFHALERDWDSYGADAILPGAIEIASKLLDVLRDAKYECPVVCPTNVGGVLFDWDTWEIKIEDGGDSNVV